MFVIVLVAMIVAVIAVVVVMLVVMGMVIMVVMMMPMVVMIGVIVVMIVVVAGMAVADIVLLIFLGEALEQVGRRRRLIGELHLFKNVIDHLLFVDGGTDRQQLIGVFTEEFVDMLLLARETTGLGR